MRTAQQPLVDIAERAGAQNVRQFAVVNGFAATMTLDAQERLATDSRVRAVVPDRVIPRRAQPTSSNVAAAVLPGAQPVCPADPAKPLLEPEALQRTNTAFENAGIPQAHDLATGKGVKVAFLADGLDVGNPDLLRTDGSRVVVDYQDFTGEGINVPTSGVEAFGDASAVAAQGRQRYDLADFVHPASPLPTGCTIRIRGVAPDASLVALKVTPAAGGATSSMVVQGIEYAITVARVDVINESLGSNPVPDNQNDPIALANRAAVAAGIAVVAASGDAGVSGTVGAPAGDPRIISVGATTSLRLAAQTQRNLPGARGWVSDNISPISSGGITERAEVVDLVAPGNNGWAVCSTDNEMFTGCTNGRGEPSPIRSFGGTSQSAPFTAGAAALVIEAYAATHHGARPSPALIKRILTSTATDLNDPADRQGAGLLNSLQAVLAGQSIKDDQGTPAAKGDNLLVDRTQLSVTAAPGSSQNLALRVTNLSSRSRTVSARNRVLSRTVSDERGQLTLDATAPNVPSWTDGFGIRRAFVTQTFTVPAGAAHLDGSIAFTPPGGRQVNLRLLDPDGKLATVFSAEGTSGFGHVDVHDPAPGLWTSIFDSRAAADGFNGTVRFAWRTTAYETLGSATPSLTLSPGQTGTIQIAVTTPSRPGDLSAAVRLDFAPNRRIAVPLTLRSLITTKNGEGTFTGRITGGNGREFTPAQAIRYRFDVPRGLRDFGINLRLNGDPGQLVFGFLESPDGQLLSQHTNTSGFDDEGNLIFIRELQEFRRDPAPGRWTFTVWVENPVSGTAVSQDFAGTLKFNLVDATATGLPHNVVLPADQPKTVRITVRNTGIAPQPFFVDARRTATGDLRLISRGPEADLPIAPAAAAFYRLPPATTRFTGTVRTTARADLEVLSITGQPAVLARTNRDNIATAVVNAAQVQPGPWIATTNLIGPFPPTGAPPATATFTAFARTQLFDNTVTSSTGNFWLTSVSGNPPEFTPLNLNPGETGVITVSITPHGPKGTTVNGVLYLADLNLFAETGDELKAFPYAYTIG